MVHLLKRHAAIALVLAASAGCTVHKAETPAPSGPSTLALSLQLNAIPDSISQDGGSQSSIKITAIGPSGRAMPSVPMRVEMRVDGVPQDYGTLSARTVVTNSEGIASVVYTAPPTPAGGVFGLCGSLVGTCVDIIATPTGTNFDAAMSQSVSIRLVPPGVILPPASTPTAAFTVSPQPATANLPLIFDASTSQPGAGSSQIVSYNWTFGDGSTGTGRTVTHTYTAQNTYSVTLTITNDRSLSASTPPTAVTVGAAGRPVPTFTVSPAAPAVGQLVFFNASSSGQGAGGAISSYRWTFGDGSTGSGATTSHSYTAAGTYTVQLTVTDDLGLTATSTGTPVTVTAPGGAPTVLTATFNFSPAAPGVGETVFFNASTSTPGAGHTIASYAWTFGDGTTGTGVNVTHAYATAGTYTVQLRVTDETGQSAISGVQTISAGSSAGPTANFTFSPATPGRNDEVVFDASSSTTPQGTTIVDVAWNFGDGTAVIHCPGSSAADCPGPTNRISAHTFTNALQTYVVNLVVTDSAGRIGSKNVSVTVVLAEPNVVINASPTTPNPGVTVNFNSSGTTFFPGSTFGPLPGSYVWNFGDGTGATGQSASHAYGAIGTYGVVLTVTDNKGRTGTRVATVSVVAVTPPTPPAPPVAAFTFSAASFAIPATVNFDAATSTSPSGAAITNYRWNFGDGSPVLNLAIATTSHVYTVAGNYTVTLIVTTGSNGLTGSTTGAVAITP